MRRGLVLGGGGLVGMAYHAGALKALEDFGIDVSGSDVIVGTSAGAILGSYLASGWNQSDFYEYAYGRHPKASRDPADHKEAVHALFEPLWGSRAERVRRSLGSIFSVVSARVTGGPGAKGKFPALN
ncbi:MAG: patatin-like phospholipase family protein [Actinomycetota bacterium]